MENVTQCTERDLDAWATTGAVTHARAATSYTRCGQLIEGYDQGWIPPIHREPTCLICFVSEKYAAAGFADISTGGGCEAYSADDPKWVAPSKVIRLTPSPGGTDVPHPIVIERDDKGVLGITWAQMLALRERIDSITEHISPSYFLATAQEDPNLPGTMDEPVDFGYYEQGDTSMRWIATLPNSHTLLLLWEVYKTGPLTMREVIRKFDQSIVITVF